MRILIVISLMFGIYSNAHCQQDRQNCDLKTVYKTLRTSEFNHAWKTYKKNSSESNPYDKLVDDLYMRNSSVATYIKKITENMRSDALEHIPKAKDQFFEYKERKKSIISTVKKSTQSSRLYLTDKAEKNLKTISNNIQNAFQRINFPIDLRISASNNLKTFGKASDQLKIDPEIDALRIDALIKLDIDCLNAETGINITNKKREQYLFGIILHELAHIKHLHSMERQLCLLNSTLHHIQEYEADWYWARKNKQYAITLATFGGLLKGNVYNRLSSDTHPSSVDRYQNLKEIRRLKEAESRWIWGPKGYEKYSDPAYEKAFSNWSEKQQ